MNIWQQKGSLNQNIHYDRITKGKKIVIYWF